VVMRTLFVLFVVQLAFQATFGAFITTYAPFASERLHWSTAEIGLVFSLFGLGSVLLGPWLARQADRRGRRLFGIIGCVLLFPFAIVYVAEAPRLILYPVTVLGGAGVTTIEASWFALLSDATDGGRRGRAFGTIVALSSLGIVIGSTVAAQLWERSGDVGLGMLVASATVAISGVVLLAHPGRRSGPCGDLTVEI
jgi:MFS family permease